MEFIDINMDLNFTDHTDTNLDHTDTNLDHTDTNLDLIDNTTLIGRPPDPDTDPEKQQEINKYLEILTYMFAAVLLAGFTYITLAERKMNHDDADS